MESIVISRKRFKIYVLVSTACMASVCHAHDTTHIHPLISAKIADLIQDEDIIDKAYTDIYLPDPEADKNIDAPQRLYWGTDFDPTGLGEAKDKKYKKE